MRAFSCVFPMLAMTVACGSSSSGISSDAGTPPGDGAAAALPFQPSNIALSDVAAQEAKAVAEDVTANCTIATDPTSPSQDCFHGPFVVVKQSDGSMVNMLVASSLTIEAAATIRVTGPVPLVLVSLGDVTLSGSIDGHSASLDVGPGGSPTAASNGPGMGAGGGAAGSGTTAVGGSGGSNCGVGGLGGGQTKAGTASGSADARPLKGGASGGGGQEGSGAGGGAIQIVASGTLTVGSSSFVSAGGEGGPIGGISASQNAGGGGSGGAILLEATTVALGGTLAANGGGGGGDYSGMGGADATSNATPAAGGAAGSSDGAGGSGAAGTSASGAAGTAPSMLNAGGGGGGAGWIRINTASGTATLGQVISPDPTTMCASVGTVREATAGP
jgi:hypothetical protein